MSIEEATWQEVEKEIKLIECLLQRLSREDRLEAACRIAIDAVIWGGDTFYEQMGILEEAKFQFRENWMEAREEEEE